VRDVLTAKEIRTLKGRFGKLALSADGHRVVSSADDNIVRVWDVQKDQESSILDRLGARGFAFSADWSRYVRSTPDKRMTVRDTQSGQEIVALQGHGVPARVVAISPDGKLVASGAGGPDPNSVDSEDQAEVRIWNAATGQELFKLLGSKGSVFGLAFSPDSKRLAGISQSPSNAATVALQVWDTASGKELFVIRGHAGPRWVVIFSPDGKHIASFAGAAVTIWDAHTGVELHTFTASDAGWPRARRNGLAYSPDGKRLACGDNEKVVVLDAETGQELVVLKGLTGGVLAITFSPDGKHLVSQAGDGKTRIWDVQSAQELLTLEGWGGNGIVAFSPDGNHLAVTGARGAVKIYDATPLPEKP
jgi:WD40 repeat protein